MMSKAFDDCRDILNIPKEEMQKVMNGDMNAVTYDIKVISGFLNSQKLSLYYHYT